MKNKVGGIVMNLIPMPGDRIDSFGYSDGTLYILFKTGALYAYYNVPPQECQNFMSAALPGEYLDEHIKGVYTYERLG